MYAFKYSFTVATAPRRGWNKFRPLRANFQCKFSFLKTYEITSHSPDGLAPPTAPLKGLAAAFLRMPRSSSLPVQDSNLPPKAPNEPFPPKAPMKPFHPKPRWKITRKNGKKTAKKMCFSRFWKGPRCFPSLGWRARSKDLLENPKRLDGGMKQSWILLLLHRHYCKPKRLEVTGFSFIPSGSASCINASARHIWKQCRNRLWSLFCSRLRHAKFKVHRSNALFQPAMRKALAPKPLLLFALCCGLCLSRAGLF